MDDATSASSTRATRLTCGRAHGHPEEPQHFATFRVETPKTNAARISRSTRRERRA